MIAFRIGKTVFQVLFPQGRRWLVGTIGACTILSLLSLATSQTIPSRDSPDQTALTTMEEALPPPSEVIQRRLQWARRGEETGFSNVDRSGPAELEFDDQSTAVDLQEAVAVRDEKSAAEVVANFGHDEVSPENSVGANRPAQLDSFPSDESRLLGDVAELTGTIETR